MLQWSALGERIAGKWQIPLFLISLAMLIGAFLRINPGTTTPPLAEGIEILDMMISNGRYAPAIVLSDHLLAEEEYSESALAPVHLRLARAHYGQAVRDRNRTASMGDRIVLQYGRASARGQELTPTDLEQLGRGYEWRKDYAEAVKCFQMAIDLGSDHRPDLLQHVITLYRQELDIPPERLEQLLASFQAELDDDRPDLRLWALEQQIEVWDALGRLDEAATFLVRYKDRFEPTDLRGRFDYLRALVLFKTGHFDEAETCLRTIRNRLDEPDELHAATGWLLGRVILSDGGPQRPSEASSFFTDVIMHHSESPYAVASRVGQAEALAYLERHDDAITAYRAVLEDLPTLRQNHLVDLDVLRTSLGVMADAQRQAGHLAAALEYARLAAELVDRQSPEQTTMVLGQLARALTLRATEANREVRGAEGVDDSIAPAASEEARKLFAEAAAVYLDLSRLNVLNERQSAEWSWRAAELYGKSGERRRAVELYQTFANERTGDPLVPRAILRTAQLERAMGRLPQAIEAYQACYRRFPRTLDGCRALVPLAECYLALGPENEGLAEKALNVVLADSAVFTPQAPEFADALFLLGDVLNRRGEFERAIATLEEAMERYPGDSRVWRTRFLIADSYRQSALALKAEMEEMTLAGELEEMQKEAAKRFDKARAYYRQLIREYAGLRGDQLDRRQRVYLRHALLYEADCYFETADYDRALKLYEEAVGTFKDSPSGLAAYVQIINCHVFLGQSREARAALARARNLVDALPDSAFAIAVSLETRDDWRRYFEWLDESELF